MTLLQVQNPFQQFWSSVWGRQQQEEQRVSDGQADTPAIVVPMNLSTSHATQAEGQEEPPAAAAASPVTAPADMTKLTSSELTAQADTAPTDTSFQSVVQPTAAHQSPPASSNQAESDAWSDNAAAPIVMLGGIAAAAAQMLAPLFKVLYPFHHSAMPASALSFQTPVKCLHLQTQILACLLPSVEHTIWCMCL